MKNLELVTTPLWNCPYTRCRLKRIGLIWVTPNGKESNDYYQNQSDLGVHVVTIAKLSTAFCMFLTLVASGRICHMTLMLLIKLAIGDCSNINLVGSDKKFSAIWWKKLIAGDSSSSKTLITTPAWLRPKGGEKPSRIFRKRPSERPQTPLGHRCKWQPTEFHLEQS